MSALCGTAHGGHLLRHASKHVQSPSSQKVTEKQTVPPKTERGGMMQKGKNARRASTRNSTWPRGASCEARCGPGQEARGGMCQWGGAGRSIRLHVAHQHLSPPEANLHGRQIHFANPSLRGALFQGPNPPTHPATRPFILKTPVGSHQGEMNPWGEIRQRCIQREALCRQNAFFHAP